MKTVSQKMGIKENSRAFFINAPDEAIDGIKLPEIDVLKTMSGEFDYIRLFVKNQSEYKDIFPKLKAHLSLSGMLWVSWPKGGKLGRKVDVTVQQHGRIQIDEIMLYEVKDGQIISEQFFY